MKRWLAIGAPLTAGAAVLIEVAREVRRGASELRLLPPDGSVAGLPDLNRSKWLRPERSDVPSRSVDSCTRRRHLGLDDLVRDGAAGLECPPMTPAQAGVPHAPAHFATLPRFFRDVPQFQLLGIAEHGDSASHTDAHIGQKPM